MLRAIILGPERELADAVYTACTQCESFAVYGAHHEFPPVERLLRIINHTDPDVVLIEIDHGLEAIVALRDIRETNPEVALVGYADERTRNIAPAEEYCEVIRGPFKPTDIREAIVRAIDKNTSKRRDNVYAFLPAKAGNGATLTAMNVAGALAHYWRQSVLVVEADLHSGCLGVALKIEPKRTVVQTLEESDELTQALWKRSVNRAHGIDWLLTARGKQTRRIAPWEYQRLLTFAGQIYDTVFVDLPEVINEATEAVVRRAAKIFVVSTPEVQALYLARRRMQDLKSRGVTPERRKVVLNRFTESEGSIQEYEKILGHPVALTIGSDYAEVRKAAAATALVNRDSALGGGYFQIAKEIAKSPPVEAPPEEKPRKGRAGMRRFFGGS